MQKDEIIKLINTYWKFDNDQDTTSTWHDKQDLINEIEQLTIPVVVGRSEQLICDTCKSGLINYPEINRRTCSCGRLGYNVTD